MKTTTCLVAIFLVIGIAVAQDANQQQNQGNSPSQAQTHGTSAQTGIGEGESQSYKGTLVDASCTASTSPSATQQAAPDSARTKERKNEANRSAENPGQACSVSANTTQFVLKLDDGRSLRFDSVGNLRAQDAMKNKKKWNEAVSSGKPVHAKVSGLMIGDKLMVMAID